MSFFSDSIDEKIDDPAMDLTLPYLTYNEPQGEFEFSLTKPILLDFYITMGFLIIWDNFDCSYWRNSYLLLKISNKV